MLEVFKASLWKQFAATIEMIENALVLCPAEMWDDKDKFWYIAFDCLFYLDYYLTLDPQKYVLPEPFEFKHIGQQKDMPARVYSKEELLTYLHDSKEKCKETVANLTDETVLSNWVNHSRNVSFPVVEILMYNMRHLQHHTGQLNLLLRQKINDAPNWVAQAKG